MSPEMMCSSHDREGTVAKLWRRLRDM